VGLEQLLNLLAQHVVERADPVRGLNFQPQGKIGDSLHVLQQQPGAHRHLLPNFVQQFGVGPYPMLERVQLFLEFANQQVSQVVSAGCIAAGFQIGYGPDPIAAALSAAKPRLNQGEWTFFALILVTTFRSGKLNLQATNFGKRFESTTATVSKSKSPPLRSPSLSEAHRRASGRFVQGQFAPRLPEEFPGCCSAPARPFQVAGGAWATGLRPCGLDTALRDRIETRPW